MRSGQSKGILNQDLANYEANHANRADFKTSMSQMTSLDGEYVILGRKGTDNGNVFIPYGEGDQFSANFTGGPGRQDAEFIDGLRFAVQSDRPLRMNVALKFPISRAELPQGMLSLSASSHPP
jgi:hypothetical protein